MCSILDLPPSTHCCISALPRVPSFYYLLLPQIGSPIIGAVPIHYHFIVISPHLLYDALTYPLYIPLQILLHHYHFALLLPYKSYSHFVQS